MSTTASGLDYPADGLAPASTLTRLLDRWIFVLMAVWLIAITLTGFIPTSLEKIAAVETGMRPPFPFQVGLLFAIYIGIALYLRKSDPGMHKRLIFLAVALPLPAAFDRIVWLAGFLPSSVLILLAWNTDWWQANAAWLVGL